MKIARLEYLWESHCAAGSYGWCWAHELIKQERRKHTKLSTSNTASRFDTHDIRDVVGEPCSLRRSASLPFSGGARQAL
jgi:hypothetical protein